MIKTENPGILEAIREIKLSSAGKVIRALYDAHMKEIRDRNAREDYVRDEGIAIGETRGRAEGELQKVISQVRKKVSRNMSAKEIADMLEEDINLISQICHVLKKYPDLNDEEIRTSLQL